MGKVLKEAGGDVQEAIDCTYYTAGEGRRLHGFTTPAEMPNKFAMCVRQPVGHLRADHAVQFPDGDPVVEADSGTRLRQHGRHQIRRGRAAFGIQSRQGVRGGRHSEGRRQSGQRLRPNIGPALVGHPDVRLISFTGSTDTGRIIAEQCARDNKIVSLEMGGKNAIIVMDDADVDNAVEGSLWGAFGTSGQRCTASSRLVVHKKIYKKFVEKLVEKVKAASRRQRPRSEDRGRPGDQRRRDGEDPRLHRDRQEHDKATLACGGNRLTKGDYAKGWFIEPTVFTDVKPGMRIAQEEIFGPVTCGHSVLDAR